MLFPLEYHKPRSTAEALRLKAAIAGARFIAGGTDLLVRIKEGLDSPPALISLRHIDELRRIDAPEGGPTRIGALCTVSEVAAHPAIRQRYGVLAQALGSLGSVQIRNSATVGGNLCNASPCADSAPPLLALGARLLAVGPAGRRELPLTELFVGPKQISLGPEELLCAIRLDPPAPGWRGIFLKKKRVAMDLALVNVALLLQPEGRICRDIRIATGSCAPTPVLLEPVMDLLRGKELTAELIERAGQLAAATIAPIDDVRASAEYRRHIAGVFVRRGITTLLNEEGTQP